MSYLLAIAALLSVPVLVDVYLSAPRSRDCEQQ